jgi:hypothetical protein
MLFALVTYSNISMTPAIGVIQGAELVGPSTAGAEEVRLLLKVAYFADGFCLVRLAGRSFHD